MMLFCFHCRLENKPGQKLCTKCKRPIGMASDSLASGSSFGSSQFYTSKVVVARTKNDIVIKNTMTSSADQKDKL